MGLLKVVRNIFNGTFDFDDTAEITLNFLPGPLLFFKCIPDKLTESGS